MDRIAETVLADNSLPYYMLSDRTDKASKMGIMNRTGLNIYGAVSRCARLLDNAEVLLGGPSHSQKGAPEEVYLYHSKVNIKESQKGGAWEWHQDYGYWYQNGCLYPRFVTIVLALTHHTLANGALRVLRGSHLAGRMTHVTLGAQQAVDPERLALVQRDFEEVVMECEPGDVYFFHCNMFHASQPNVTDTVRASLLTCYNARSNNPIRKHHHRFYNPLDRWSDQAIMDFVGKGYEEGDGTEPNDPYSEVYNEDT